MAKLVIVLLSTVILLLKVSRNAFSYQLDNNPFKRAEILDAEGKFLLEWEIHWNSKTVTFNTTVQTLGWVGFGLSNNGKPTGVDMVIGGEKNDGRFYFSDRHVERASELSLLDEHQDWKLNTAWESETHTFLSFTREFDTCDPEDYEITPNRIALLWAYGASDDENGRSVEAEGVFNVHLLDPEYSPKIVRDGLMGHPTIIRENSNKNIPQDTKVWTIETSRLLESNDTSYICTFHKAPRLRKKHHWIGFDIEFANEESRTHSHHMVIYKCTPPIGVSNRDMFHRHIDNPGQPCYVYHIPPPRDTSFPVQLCTELLMNWGTGTKAYFSPDHVGIPFGETEDEYYVLQMHYDNPERLSNLQVSIRFDFFYTGQLRPNEGGRILIAHDAPFLPESMLVPPHSTNHRIFAHCPSECTQRMIPPEGIYITAATLHQHNAGSGVRIRHFRGDREQPWILYDDNFDNSFQLLRTLKNEVKILPGDQITFECHYTTNEKSISGGFPTHKEMCMLFLYYHSRVPGYTLCVSGLNSEAQRERFLGIRNISWVEDGVNDWVVNTPEELSRLTIADVADHFVDWTSKKRVALQRYHDLEPQDGRCIRERALTPEQFDALPRGTLAVIPTTPVNTSESFIGPVSYMFHATPYIPPKKQCHAT